MADILQITFLNVFFWMKKLEFIKISLKFGSESSSDNRLALAGNGLAPNKWQAITWTNVDKDLWCHMMSLGHNELNIVA